MTAAMDLLDRRVLAAFRLRDPLGRPVGQRLVASAPGLDLMGKGAGEWVVTRADALPTHHLTFAGQPAAPAIGSVDALVSIKAFGGKFMSRDFTLKLPRDPDPSHRDQANSLFRWHEVVMPFGTTASLAGMAASALVTVTRKSDHFPIEGAIVRMRPNGNRGEAIGVTNAAGEALLALQTVPLSNSGGGANVTPDLNAKFDTIVDPDLVSFNDPADLASAQRRSLARMSGFVDPDDVVARLSGSATPPATVKIAAGQLRTTTLSWSAP